MLKLITVLSVNYISVKLEEEKLQRYFYPRIT